MRLSANTDSPFFYCYALADTGMDPHAVECWIDGVKINHVVEADSDAGWADVLALDASGIPRTNGKDGLVIERVHARVEFRLGGVAI